MCVYLNFQLITSEVDNNYQEDMFFPINLNLGQGRQTLVQMLIWNPDELRNDCSNRNLNMTEIIPELES